MILLSYFNGGFYEMKLFNNRTLSDTQKYLYEKEIKQLKKMLADSQAQLKISEKYKNEYKVLVESLENKKKEYQKLIDESKETISNYNKLLDELKNNVKNLKEIK